MEVSVVMITYNHEKYIEKAINGVLKQESSFPVELIIANDCSTDKTDALINALIKEYAGPVRIAYTNHKQNKGMLPNFVWALSKASGNFVAFCEGDDEWIDSKKLEKQVQFMNRNKDVVICGTGSLMAKNEGQAIVYTTTNHGLVSLEDVLYRNRFTTCTAMVRRQYVHIPPFENYFDFFTGDWPLWASLLRFGKGYNLPDCTARYNVHPGGAVSGRKIEKALADKINDRYQMVRNFPEHKALIRSYGRRIVFSYLKMALTGSVPHLTALLKNRSNLVGLFI